MIPILTGHGCFGVYINRIGRKPKPQCHHCGSKQDSAQHTLEECPAWLSEQADLIQQISKDLSRHAVIAAMLECAAAWEAVSTFCKTIMI